MFAQYYKKIYNKILLLEFKKKENETSKMKCSAKQCHRFFLFVIM